ncbi:uncharacterized protein LOC123430865 [Hordeum vulgare subsp. vulgare]|uniref:Predicted protein n=1 Tax=Hordeum vulgare subsp. vulgare TaxID=112509 RepID=F2DZT3_HORVV|nr:uncharacterized protein LOC123430865 [Hordeum vulgare subsp. vulgare]BAK00605.1 predicted protein [Hordeum vulgare subsp. vulgare]
MARALFRFSLYRHRIPSRPWCGHSADAACAHLARPLPRWILAPSFGHGASTLPTSGSLVVHGAGTPPLQPGPSPSSTTAGSWLHRPTMLTFILLKREVSWRPVEELPPAREPHYIII